MNAQGLSKQKRNLIFTNIVISSIASTMLTTALTTALPAIVDEFHVGVAMGQWLTSGYSLVMGLMMPLTAFLIKRFSTRRLYLSGLLIFLSGLAACVAASNFPFMMFARVLQAIGGGIISAMSQVLVLSIYTMEERGTAMGWYGLSIGAAPVIAPTLAGVVVDVFDWRAIFYITIFIMLISLAFAFAIFTDVLPTDKAKFDTVSFILSCLAFGGVTLGIGNIGSYQFVSLQVIGILAVGILFSFIFVGRQLYLERPFLELRILKNKKYAVSVVGSILLYLVMMGATIIMPLYVQSVLGYSATTSGLVILPGSLSMALVSPFVGKAYDRVGMKVLFVCGAAGMFASNFCMFFVSRETGLFVAMMLNVLRNVSIGCLLMPFVTWGTSEIRKELTADATALLTALRTMAGAIGGAIFVGIMNAVAEKSIVNHGVDAPLQGVKSAFLCMGGVSLLLLLASLFLCERKRGER
jgi:EmrB/QacA subfamily drug resistance transporter